MLLPPNLRAACSRTRSDWVPHVQPGAGQNALPRDYASCEVGFAVHAWQRRCWRCERSRGEIQDRGRTVAGGEASPTWWAGGHRGGAPRPEFWSAEMRAGGRDAAPRVGCGPFKHANVMQLWSQIGESEVVGLSDLQETRITEASHDFLMSRVLHHTVGSQSIIRREFFPFPET